MIVAVVFDDAGKDADIIEIDKSVLDNIGIHKFEFCKWMFDKNNKHRYWRKTSNGSMYCAYRAEAFLEWLRDSGIDENAKLIEECASNIGNLPIIEF